jgi:tight adherence protein C
MVLLFVLGIGLVIVAILLVGSAMNTQTESGVTRSLAVLEAMTNAPKELNKELDKPFAERVLAPLQERAVGLGRRTSPATRPAGRWTGSSPARSPAPSSAWSAAWCSSSC